MMQTLTKTELAWIHNALLHKIQHCHEAMANYSENNPVYRLAEMDKENITATMKKICAIVEGECNRIAIK